MRGDKRTLLERLEGKFLQKGSDECWPWVAAADNYGRGRITVNQIVRVAAQVILEAHGFPRPAPPNDAALHKPSCHPSCSNPAHLRWGSQYDNMQDKIVIGTSRHKPGTLFNKSSITEQDVREIRKSSLTLREQAELYDISERAVWDIRKRKSWQWVEDC
jgi:hypothetical protein